MGASTKQTAGILGVSLRTVQRWRAGITGCSKGRPKYLTQEESNELSKVVNAAASSHQPLNRAGVREEVRMQLFFTLA
jgi:hypothetical protein